MGEFFKGWRRKAGLVTLAMACVLMIGWMRSLAVTDVFSIWINEPRQRRLLAIESHYGEIGWQDFGSAPLIGNPSGWSSYANNLRPPDPLAFNTVPYWSLVLPLTLLSAWLILIKPRKAKGSP